MSAIEPAVLRLLDDLFTSEPAYQRNGMVSGSVAMKIKAVLTAALPCPRRRWWSRERNHRSVGVGDYRDGAWWGSPGESNYICLFCGKTSSSSADIRELR